MPELKNTKHELFAQALAKGKTQIEAYVEAGYQPNDGNAAKTANRDDVQTRVKEITGKGAELASFTVAKALEEFEEARLGAMEDKKYGSAVAATLGKARVAGILNENPPLVANTQVNITSDNDAARRIGYILAKGMLRLQEQKQIEDKVEEEGK